MNDDTTPKAGAPLQLDVWRNLLCKSAGVAAEVNDPTDKGTVQIPKPVDSTPKDLGTPAPAPANSDEGSTEDALMNVTKPNGSGQGSYVRPEDGNRKDEISSPGAPLAKIAANLTARLSNISPESAPQQEKKASTPATQGTQMTPEMAPGILEKLASISSMMLQTEEGAALASRIMQKEAGVKEASQMISEALAGVQYLNSLDEAMSKKASEAIQERNENYVLNQMTPELREATKRANVIHNRVNGDATLPEHVKAAYNVGATDAGKHMDDAAAGQEATLDDGDAMNMDVILSGLQEMIDDGEITEEEATAVLQQLAATSEGEAPEQAQVSEEELAEILKSLSEEQAMALLQEVGLSEEEIAALSEGGAAPAEEVQEEEIVKEASARTQSVISAVFS